MDTPPEAREQPSELRLLDELDVRMAAGDDPLRALAAILSASTSARTALLDLQGTLIHGFELTSILGVGGMGVTYAATDGFDHVAVKVVEGLSEPACKRFDTECRILQTLTHPNIVRYRRHGILPTGTAWLMMDLVRGTDLQRVLDETVGEVTGRSPATAALLADIEPSNAPARMSPVFRQRAVRLIARVSDALHYAHEAGVVHGDVKPANILVGENLQPILIDFGLSRDLFRGVSLTRTAGVMGTLSYMAPEQLLGDAASIDRRTDVFALGLVFYRVLCGADLRTQSDQVLRYHRRRFLMPAAAARDVPSPIQATLYRCLEPKRRHRYATAAHLADDLRAIDEGRRTRARRPNVIARHLRSRNGLLTKALGAAALVAALAWAAWPAPVLSVDALDDKATGRVIIDGRDTGLHTPLEGYPIGYGEHTIEYRSVGLRPVTKTVDVRNPHTRANFLPIPDSWEPAHTFDARPDSAFLVVHPGDAANAFTVDGRSAEPLSRWIALAPGRHLLEARSPAGLVERQFVHLDANELHPVQMLSPELADRPGSFRLTLGQVLSPFPDGIELQLEGSAVQFMDGKREPSAEPRRIQTHCYITPMEPHEWATATLRVTFPQRMRSIWFHFHINVNEDRGDIEVAHRVDDEEWVRVPLQENRERYRERAAVPEGGGRRLELRARMRVRQPPVSFATLQFLHSYMDQVDDVANAPACFAIAGEPEQR